MFQAYPVQLVNLFFFFSITLFSTLNIFLLPYPIIFAFLKNKMYIFIQFIVFEIIARSLDIYTN
jgi:hypothetical protein